MLVKAEGLNPKKIILSMYLTVHIFKEFSHLRLLPANRSATMDPARTQSPIYFSGAQGSVLADLLAGLGPK